MAHTFDAKVRNPATANTSSTSNPLDTTFTPGAGATVIVLTIAYAGTTNNRSGGDPTLVEDSLTFLQADQVRRGPAPEGSVELWYLLAPPTGSAKTIRVPNAGAFPMVVIVASFKAQSGYTSALDVANGGAQQTASPSVSVTTTVNGDVIVAGVFSDNNGWTPTGRSGTQLYDDDNGGWGEGAQYLLQATAGAQAMSWTFAGTGDWGLCVAAFKEVAAAGDQTKTVTDSGAGTEAIGGVTVSLALTDSGSGAETFSGAASLELGESGSGADLLAVSAAVAVHDAGTGVDAASQISVALTVNDAGAGADIINLLTGGLMSILETGAGVDGISISVAPLAITESGAGADSLAIRATVVLADTASGMDAVSLLQSTYKLVSELATGTDAIGSVSVSLAVPESGAGIDLVSQILAWVILAETGSGVEVAVAFDSVVRIAMIDFTIARRSTEFTLASRRIDFTLASREIDF